MLVSAAHDQDTPAVPPVPQACQLGQELRHGEDRGRQGSKLKTACIDDPFVARMESPATTVYGENCHILLRIIMFLA